MFKEALIVTGVFFPPELANHKASTYWCVLCLVDRASLYNLVNKANLVHNFS